MSEDPYDVPLDTESTAASTNQYLSGVCAAILEKGLDSVHTPLLCRWLEANGGQVVTITVKQACLIFLHTRGTLRTYMYLLFDDY